MPIRSLDGLFTSFDVDGHLPVTLMKIDVEGTEDEVLAEGDRFLAGMQPDILCEILPEANVDAVEKVHVPHGYRFFTVTERGLLPRRDLVAPIPIIGIGFHHRTKGSWPRWRCS